MSTIRVIFLVFFQVQFDDLIQLLSVKKLNSKSHYQVKDSTLNYSTPKIILATKIKKFQSFLIDCLVMLPKFYFLLCLGILLQFCHGGLVLTTPPIPSRRTTLYVLWWNSKDSLSKNPLITVLPATQHQDVNLVSSSRRAGAVQTLF